MNIPLASKPILYFAAVGYAVLAFIVGEDGIIMIEVLGFGLPVLFWPLMEWVVPLLVAVTEGSRAHESIPRALLSIPLVLLFAVVTPTVKGRNIIIPARIPWLADHSSSASSIVPILFERSLLWVCIFVVAAIVWKKFKPLRTKRQ